MSEELNGEAVEVVGVVCVSRFNNHPAMENVEFQLAADIPQGQHEVMTVAQHRRIVAAKDADIARLDEVVSHVRMQASVQAQEARTQKSIVSEIGAMVGCDDDFLTAGAVRDALAKQSAPAERVVVLQGEREAFEDWIKREAGDHAAKRWPTETGQGYANDRVQDYRTGWVECLQWQARLNPAPAEQQPAAVVPDFAQRIKWAVRLCKRTIENGMGGYTTDEILSAVINHLEGREPLDAPAPVQQVEEAAHNINLLAKALGECIQAAGITAPGASLDGPQLLMFAEDLKEYVQHLKDENKRLGRDYEVAREAADSNLAELAALKAQQAAVVAAYRLRNCYGEVITEWHDSPAPERITDLCWVVQIDVTVELAYKQPAPQQPWQDVAVIHAYNRGYLAGHHDTVEGQFTDIAVSDMATANADQVSDLLAAHDKQSGGEV